MKSFMILMVNLLVGYLTRNLILIWMRITSIAFMTIMEIASLKIHEELL